MTDDLPKQIAVDALGFCTVNSLQFRQCLMLYCNAYTASETDSIKFGSDYEYPYLLGVLEGLVRGLGCKGGVEEIYAINEKLIHASPIVTEFRDRYAKKGDNRVLDHNLTCVGQLLEQVHSQEEALAYEYGRMKRVTFDFYVKLTEQCVQEAYEYFLKEIKILCESERNDYKKLDDESVRFMEYDAFIDIGVQAFKKFQKNNWYATMTKRHEFVLARNQARWLGVDFAPSAVPLLFPRRGNEFERVAFIRGALEYQQWSSDMALELIIPSALWFGSGELFTPKEVGFETLVRKYKQVFNYVCTNDFRLMDDDAVDETFDDVMADWIDDGTVECYRDAGKRMSALFHVVVDDESYDHCEEPLPKKRSLEDIMKPGSKYLRNLEFVDTGSKSVLVKKEHRDYPAEFASALQTMINGEKAIFENGEMPPDDSDDSDSEVVDEAMETGLGGGTVENSQQTELF